MEKVYCNNLECESNLHIPRMPPVCTRKALTLSTYSSYVEFARKFSGTLRCTDFIKRKE